MNKSYLLATLWSFFLVSLCFGQTKVFLPSSRTLHTGGDFNQKSTTTPDTLGQALLNADSVALYPAVSGGYIGGNNGFGDKAKAQAFKNDTVFGITKVLFWFGSKKWGGNSESGVSVRIYKTNGLGKTTKGNSQLGAPNEILAQKTLLISAIDTSGAFTELLYDYPVVVDTDFAAGIGFDLLVGNDSLALFSGYDGQADSTELAWEMLNTGVWATLFRSWPLNADLAIFPVVDLQYNGINEERTKQTYIYPNPSNGSINITPFKQGKKYLLFLTDLQGKLVAESHSNWSESILFSLPNCKPGTYTVTQVIDGLAVQEKLIVH